ncbi:MAG: hypothetical protein KGI60_02635 [Patescibacteria group bacterium]|nr:hypothetical protein [Patescibacteria group bacterium]
MTPLPHTAQRRGQSLVELLLAFGLTTLFLSALISGLVSSQIGAGNEANRLLAVGYAREAEEAMRSIREQGWSMIATNGDYHTVLSAGGQWSLGSSSELVNGFLREVLIDDAQRDSNGVLVETGGTVDPSTKRVTVQVSWGDGFVNTLKTIYFLTRYLGNTFFTHTTLADFSPGTFNNTQTSNTGDGAIGIKSSNQSNIYDEPFSTATSYAYNSSLIQVSGGNAHLVNLGSPTNSAGANPSFDTNSTGWTFASFGNNIGQTGTWYAAGGNPGGYVDLSFGSSKNKDGFGYWYEPITINATNVNATVSLQWDVTAFNLPPTSMQVYAFVDPTTADPVLGQQVWSSGEIIGTSGWSGTITADASSKITTPGTYYLKIMVEVNTTPSTGGPPFGPYTVGIDNAQLSWTGNAVSYSTSGPTIQPAAAFSDSGESQWTSFTETATKNGGEVYYQLQYTGTDWMYWNGTAWATSTVATNYNTAATVNSHIATFPAWSHQITVKAFLVSNSQQQIYLDDVQIAYTSGTTLTTNTPFTTPGNYTYNSSEIDVTGGFAQLHGSTSSVGASTTNPGFDAGSTGWTFTSFGNNVSQSGNWISSGGDPGGYINMTFPAFKNKTADGFWSQPLSVTQANSTGTLTFNWSATAYQATPTSFEVYAFVDTTNANPVIGQEVWNSGQITGTTAWSETVSVDVSSKIAATGTYYTKLMVEVISPNGGNIGPYTVGFDNAQLQWIKSTTTYPTDSPTINPTTSFADPNITGWVSFTETATKNGGEIYYQLSDNDGSTWQFWNGTAWTTAVLATDYNTAAAVNTNIGAFSSVNKRIMFKAFLVSSGTQFIQLDNIAIGYSSGTYAATGTYVSPTFDAGANVGFNRITWTDTTDANNYVKFQVATNSDNTTFEFHGPDGTTSSYYSLTNGAIAYRDVSNRYLRYKIYMGTTVASDKPQVLDVTVNYSP